MYHHFLKFSFLLLITVSLTGNAQTLSKQDVPEKIFDYIYKKHPEAKDISITEKKHFNQPLYEANFTAKNIDKNGQSYEEKITDLFRINGHFYTNALVVDHNAFNIMSSAAVNSLKSHYPKYEILAMKTVINPNTVGEEYEINMLLSGKIWNISINDQGEIITETRN
ncbi:MAG: hypothetical protein QM500_09790 [Methylococcales bacterium]